MVTRYVVRRIPLPGIMVALAASCGGSGGGGGLNGPGPVVIPNIAGLWAGTQRITAVTHDVCSPQPGDVTQVQVQITQTGSDIRLQQIGDQGLNDLTGFVRADGTFTVTGSIGLTSERIDGQVSNNRLTASGRVGETGVCIVFYSYDMGRS